MLDMASLTAFAAFLSVVSAQTSSAGFSVPAIAAITSGAPEQATPSLTSTFAAGSKPTGALADAPAIPTFLDKGQYPALDEIPSINSTEVQRWISQIDWSLIPNYTATTGECGTSPEAEAQTERCWWTCGGCTRETDITECPDKLTWGLSFDDGPSPYTPALLNYLNEANLTTTWFVVGSRVISRPEMVVAEYMTGHQLSIHTWSHPALTSLSNHQIVAELGWTAKAIRDVVGVTPNTFRPPYGDIDDRVRAIAAQMGLTPIMWTAYNGTTFDTTDWNIPGGKATGETALQRFETILEDYAPKIDTGFIVLEHDLYQSTVDLAVGYFLPLALKSGSYMLKSVIDCLHLPLSEAYMETSNNATSTLITAAPSGTFYQAKVGPQATGLTTSANPSTTSASGASVSASGSATEANFAAASQKANSSAARLGTSAALVLGALVASLTL